MDEELSQKLQNQTRVFQWVENLETSLSSSDRDLNPPRKTKLDEPDPIANHQIGKRTLRDISGNSMASAGNPNDDDQLPPRRVTRTRNAKNIEHHRTPQFKSTINVAQHHIDDDEAKEATPKPHSLADPPVVFTRPPFPARTDPSSLSRSFASSASGKRSASPIKSTTDLQMAQRPTDVEILDGKSAKVSGGVLGEYRKLYTIGQGIGVIPSSMKVRSESKFDHSFGLTRSLDFCRESSGSG